MKKSALFTSLAFCSTLIGTSTYAADTMDDDVKMFQNGTIITLTGAFKTCNKDHHVVTVNASAGVSAKDADKITNKQFKALSDSFISQFGQTHGKTLDRFMENIPTTGIAPMTSLAPVYRSTPEGQDMFRSYLHAALGFQKDAKSILGENGNDYGYKTGPYNYTTGTEPSTHCRQD